MYFSSVPNIIMYARSICILGISLVIAKITSVYNILSTSDHILIKTLCIYINELLKHNDSILNI